MPFHPIPDQDVDVPDKKDSDHHFSREYLDFLNELKLEAIAKKSERSDKVVQLIRKFLDEAFSTEGSSLIGDRINSAMELSKKARDLNSSDEVLRDAERFLYGLSAEVNKDPVHITLITGISAEVYEGLKAVAHGLKDRGYPAMEQKMRSDQHPTSRASLEAIRWARTGIESGLFISGKKEFEGPRHQLPSQSKSKTSGLKDTPDLQFSKP